MLNVVDFVPLNLYKASPKRSLIRQDRVQVVSVAPRDVGPRKCIDHMHAKTVSGLRVTGSKGASTKTESEDDKESDRNVPLPPSQKPRPFLPMSTL